MSPQFGPLPDHANPEFIGCLLTCLASSDPDIKMFWMCYAGCFAASHMGESDDEEDEEGSDDEEDEEGSDELE